MTRDEVLWHKCPAQSIIHRALEYVCSKFSGIPLSVCSLDVHIRISPNEKYMKFTHLYQSSYKIKLFLVLEISFVQKVSLFTLSSKYFPLYFMFTWFNSVMFFSLVFVKKTIKSRQFMYEILFNHQCKCVKVPQSPYIKISMPLFCCYLFFKDFLNLSDQQNGKQTFFE